MTCSHCVAADDIFDRKHAEKDLKAYHKNGPDKTTQRLIDAIRQLGRVEGATVLDIGGGIGAIQHELVAAGAEQTVQVDASNAYLQVAQTEAEQRGYAERASYHHGDFVQLAPDLDSADIVTLDKALCCYPDVRAFVSSSAGKAGQVWAAVFPRDGFPMRYVAPLLNLVLRVRGNPFRLFVHDNRLIDELLAQQGLRRVVQERGFLWQVVVYSRE